MERLCRRGELDGANIVLADCHGHGLHYVFSPVGLVECGQDVISVHVPAVVALFAGLLISLIDA